MLPPRLAFSLVLAASIAAAVAGCADTDAGPAAPGELLGRSRSMLTAAQRRARAGQIRDAAAARGLEQGWLLAGIADAETGMSHCWSELTWACMGPASADCGGGPVVAGAGDGPCSLMQGGLGMFQFDAGTYDQTLAREGARVLSVAGNTEAAVDFVIAMVIRSTYIPGVDNAAQALDWMNGVRIDNDRFRPWIQTVTHYYNGCTPSGCSVYDSRYASYERHARDTYNEMGADFWVTSVDYRATFVAQSFPYAAMPFELAPGAEQPGYIEMRNAGAATWMPGVTMLGTTGPRDVASPLAGPDWPSASRAATVDRSVPPGEVGRFSFTVRAPLTPGDYPQFFNLVQEGAAWFSDQGGPPDMQLQVRVTVLDVPPVVDAGASATDAGSPLDVDAGTPAARRPLADDVDGCEVAGHAGAAGRASRGWFAVVALGVFALGVSRRRRRSR